MPIYKFNPDDLSSPLQEFTTPLQVVQHLGSGLTVKLVERHLLYQKPRKLNGFVFSRTIATKPVPKQPATPRVGESAMIGELPPSRPTPPHLSPYSPEETARVGTSMIPIGDVFQQISEQITAEVGMSADRDVPRGTPPNPNNPEIPDSSPEPILLPEFEIILDEDSDEQDHTSSQQFSRTSDLLAAASRARRKKP